MKEAIFSDIITHQDPYKEKPGQVWLESQPSVAEESVPSLSVMDDLSKEIHAYGEMREKLEAEHMGAWVLFFGGKYIGFYVSFETAAEEAVRRFGSGPYLIRQVGAPPIALSASVIYHMENG